MITSNPYEQVQCSRLDLFVSVHIQTNGIAFVVDNYQPIREQYYAQRYPQSTNTQWEDQTDVQCTTR
jgi:hypothetical protein